MHAAVVDAAARASPARDPELLTWWRSCAKPFQVMPCCSSGGFDALGWGDDQLALACASHGGEPEHVAIAAAHAGERRAEEGDLACGPHEPLSAAARAVLRASWHAEPTRLHNNCSGKHAAMLARAVTARLAARRATSATTIRCRSRPARDTVAQWAGLDTSEIARAVDGCGVTVFALPLDNMALAYARLAERRATATRRLRASCAR